MVSFSTPVYASNHHFFGCISKPRSTGTSILACEFDDGVIIGADSQITSRDYITNRTAEKLFQLDNRIYCSGSGPVNEIQAVIDNAIHQLRVLKLHSDAVSVLMASEIVRRLCFYNRDSLNSEFLVCGWDDINGRQIYSISSRGMTKRESVFAIGSGSSYVYGYVDAYFRENMGEEEAKVFVRKTLALAISRDCSSGGQIGLAVITKEGVEKKLIPTDMYR